MGKRERRRKRERAKKHQAQRRAPIPEPIIREFPAGSPRLRVVIRHDAPEDAQKISALYWELKDDGTWARSVSSIGGAGNAGAVAVAHSHAILLNCPCANCAEPLDVTNRSWANKVGGRFLDVEAPSYLCGECTAAQRREDSERLQRAAEQKRVEQEREEQEAELLQRLVSRAIEAEDGKTEPGGSLPTDTPLALALYVALISYATHNPGKPLPRLTSVAPLGWTGDLVQDRDLLLALYYAHLLAIAPESPSEAFALSQDGDDITFVSTEVVWRVVGGLAAAQERVKEIKYLLQTQPGPHWAAARTAFTALVDRMEVTDITGYLNDLLTKKYGYPEVPEARREELTQIVRKGLAHGYTSGQMICFAWRAVDSAASWKERNPRMGPPEAASASVTTLEGKIDKAIELHHSIPEYDTPRWHSASLALGSFRQLNDEIRWVHNREVIDACARCDRQGLKETVQPETGACTLWRCTHPIEIPDQHVEEELSHEDGAPGSADA
ncbi:hypothetical protein ACH4TS_19160 [Streptomyces albidoflavus]